MASRRNFTRRNRRAPLRKFVWARATGFASAPETSGVDLLDLFQAEYGAQLLGCTVVRIRGFVTPFVTGGTAGETAVSGRWGIIVESDNELSTQDPLVQGPGARPHDDWMMWAPFSFEPVALGPVGDQPATWNAEASVWGVDIKSNRKIEELGQGLHLWYDYVASGGVNVNLDYQLSIGLKMP